MSNQFLEWLFDEEDDPDFIPLCPEEIEANLPNGQMSFRVKPKSLLIKNSATGSKYLSTRIIRLIFHRPSNI